MSNEACKSHLASLSDINGRNFPLTLTVYQVCLRTIRSPFVHHHVDHDQAGIVSSVLPRTATRLDTGNLLAAVHAGPFIMYDLSNGRNREAAKRIPGMRRGPCSFPSSLRYAPRLRWSGVAAAIRCPFSRHPVSVCFGNDPSTPNDIPRTGKANRLLPPREYARVFFGTWHSLYARNVKLESRFRALDRVLERVANCYFVPSSKRPWPRGLASRDNCRNVSLSVSL